MNPHEYGITIRRIMEEERACFEARIRELPDLAEYADTFEEAYALAIDAIETTAEALSEQGRSMPVPEQESNDYSGRITLRLPRSLHRELAWSAKQEGVSLNQLLASVLSLYTGRQMSRFSSVHAGTWVNEATSCYEKRNENQV
jgi:predicted HicB family RNase H-like nuclease